MYKQRTRHEIHFENGPITMTVHVTATWTEEPMVHYYPDGSGYPGSSDMEFEIDEIEIFDPAGEKMDITLSPKAVAVLDSMLEGKIEYSDNALID
jgi:hypothetical protein